MGRNPSEDQQVNILHFSIQVYYDDNDVLCDFWQYFVTEQKDFSDPLDIWLRHFTKPFGETRAIYMNTMLEKCILVKTNFDKLFFPHRKCVRLEHLQRILEGLGTSAPCSEVSQDLCNMLRQKMIFNSRHGTTSVDQLSEMEEERLKAILLKPLEQMICGGEDVETVWERLRQADTQSDVCGKVFKAGETCYNCKVGFGVKK